MSEPRWRGGSRVRCCVHPGVWCVDRDGDGFGDPLECQSACEKPRAGYVESADDCDDAFRSIHPGAEEQCNGLDDSCSGSIDDVEDVDEDGVTVCEGDCDDDNSQIYPGAPELCDGLDNGCLGTDASTELLDDDGDGSSNCEDCASEDPAIHPDAQEVCNGMDDDCDGTVDEGVSYPYCPDGDGDGYGDSTLLELFCVEGIPEGYAICGDCDDENPLIHPEGDELCNGLDDDCDGALTDAETDGDGDGISSCDGDCNDGDASIFPGAEDVCDDGVDQDCSGAERLCPEEDNDGDNFTELAGDCNDRDATVYPGASEACADGLDNDCDGEIDEEGGYDPEPNDSLEEAIDLGTLDTENGEGSCTTLEGQLSSTDGVDYYTFYSVDQLNDDWSIRAVLTPPEGEQYCVALLEEDGGILDGPQCGVGPTPLTSEVSYIPQLDVSGWYIVQISSPEAVGCGHYTLEVCGF